MRDEITYPFLNFNGATMLGLKLNHVSKRGYSQSHKPGPLATKRKDVLLQDLVKSPSREIRV